MNLKKTTIIATITASLSAPSLTSANNIIFDFTGVWTFVSASGAININASAANTTDGQGNTYSFGSRTPISGAASFNTATGVGSATINPFSFDDSIVSNSSMTLQAIGDGMGGTAGSLVAGVMSFDWNGNVAVPVTAIFDAAGFFDSIGAAGDGDSWTVQTGCTGCATSATPDTIFGNALGDVPIAMTSWNTAGITMGSLLPLADDGITGSPMTTPPFPGANFAYDFTTISATNVPQVPVPAAAWLFGSGLVGLMSVARRRRQS